MILYKRWLVGFIAASSTAACSAATPVLTGPTDEKMLATVTAAIARGERHFVVNSRGGRESTALDIAELIEQSGSSLIVDGACTSSCSQYLMVAANEVVVTEGAVVAFHLNSAGILALRGLDVDSIPNLREIQANASRAAALYRRRGVKEGFLREATAAMQPNCLNYTSNSVRLYAAFDSWIPSKAYLDEVGFKIQGYWPQHSAEAMKLAARYYRQSARIIYGETRLAEQKISSELGRADQCQAVEDPQP